MTWQWQEGNNLKYLLIPEWAERGVTATFSSRSGGLSTGVYSSLNLGLHVDDASELVVANRRLFLDELGIPFRNCVIAEQVHGDSIKLITNQDKGKGMETIHTAIPATDGMITNESGIALMAFFADCVPIYFFHPDIRIVGIAHAGWKGTVKNIAGKMAAKISSFGGHPSRCLAAIGPCIGKCCYEVDEKVGRLFLENVPNANEFINQIKNSTYEKNKYKLDLAAANKELLLAEGLSVSNILEAGICNSCRENDFYSYRRDSGMTGRMAGVISLNAKTL